MSSDHETKAEEVAPSEAKNQTDEADEQTMPYDIDEFNVGIVKGGGSSPTNSSSTTIDDPPVDDPPVGDNQSTPFNLAMSDVSKDKMESNGKSDAIEPTLAYNMADDGETDDETGNAHVDPTVPYNLEEDGVSSITSATDKKDTKDKQGTGKLDGDDPYVLDTDDELKTKLTEEMAVSKPPLALATESISEVVTKKKHTKLAVLSSDDEMEAFPFVPSASKSVKHKPNYGDESPILADSPTGNNQSEEMEISKQDPCSSMTELAKEAAQHSGTTKSRTTRRNVKTKSSTSNTMPEPEVVKEDKALDDDISSKPKAARKTTKATVGGKMDAKMESELAKEDKDMAKHADTTAKGRTTTTKATKSTVDDDLSSIMDPKLPEEDKELAQHDDTSISTTKRRATRGRTAKTATAACDTMDVKMGPVSSKDDVSDSEEQLNATKNVRGKKKAKVSSKKTKGKRVARGTRKAESPEPPSIASSLAGDDGDSESIDLSSKMDVEGELLAQSSTMKNTSSSPEKKTVKDEEIDANKTPTKDVSTKADKIPLLSLAKVCGESKLCVCVL